ncbi:MAG: hypothetical protein ACTHJZ_00990 [Trinickia sp.]|uniref:hypothetical protein n=1 Tax=Trinickia sp. TaxID=2571163 RepID=UPI003F7F01FE
MTDATTPKRATGRTAGVPKHANGHARAHSDARSIQVNEAATEPAHVSVKAGKKGRTGKTAAAVPAPEKTKRQKKEKVVRDSFTMPKSDYERIASLKQKCLDAGVAVKKSELLRAGLILLDALSSKRLVAAVSTVETVKTGRPAKD